MTSSAGLEPATSNLRAPGPRWEITSAELISRIFQRRLSHCIAIAQSLVLSFHRGLLPLHVRQRALGNESSKHG